MALKIKQWAIGEAGYRVGLFNASGTLVEFWDTESIHASDTLVHALSVCMDQTRRMALHTLGGDLRMEFEEGPDVREQHAWEIRRLEGLK